MSERQRKIMLIGATGYNQSDDEIRIECFEWREIKIPRVFTRYL